jgi:hypothetical protein
MMGLPDRRWSIRLLRSSTAFSDFRFLLRGRKVTQTEIRLAAMVYNLKRMLRVLGGTQLRVTPAS